MRKKKVAGWIELANPHDNNSEVTLLASLPMCSEPLLPQILFSLPLPLFPLFFWAWTDTIPDKLIVYLHRPQNLVFNEYGEFINVVPA